MTLDSFIFFLFSFPFFCCFLLSWTLTSCSAYKNSDGKNCSDSWEEGIAPMILSKRHRKPFLPRVLSKEKNSILSHTPLFPKPHKTSILFLLVQLPGLQVVLDTHQLNRTFHLCLSHFNYFFVYIFQSSLCIDSLFWEYKYLKYSTVIKLLSQFHKSALVDGWVLTEEETSHHSQESDRSICLFHKPDYFNGAGDRDDHLCGYFSLCKFLRGMLLLFFGIIFN